MKKYIKNLGISASIIATANTNIAMEAPGTRTGAITIVLDGKEYKDNGKTKFKIKNEGNSEENIIDILDIYFDKFTNDGKTIDGSAKKYLITEIKGEEVKHNEDMTYAFIEGKPLEIHLKSKKYIKIKYTGWQKFHYIIENNLIEAITSDKNIADLFNYINNYFKGSDLGKSNINGKGKNNKIKFSEIDGDEVIITIDSSQIKDDYIRRVFIEPAGSVDFIKPNMLDKLNYNIDPDELNFTLGKLKTTLFNEFKVDEDGNEKVNGKPIITGPFKIQIDGTGNEISSDEGAIDFKSANYIYLIVDKNTFNPIFLKKELKFDIVGGKDNYIISDDTKNKIQGSLNTLTNTEEVTEDAIIDELKKLENDVFVNGGIVGKNIKCYKTGENIEIKSNFGTDITVKIDPKAIKPDKIKIKLTLGNIKNNENINLDSAVVNAINEKLKAVNYGISIKEILNILNNNELKSYFTEALVDTDILDNNGNALTHNVSNNSIIKINADKIKSEHFKKVQEEDKDKDNDDDNDETNKKGTQKVDKKGCSGRYGK